VLTSHSACGACSLKSNFELCHSSSERCAGAQDARIEGPSQSLQLIRNARVVSLVVSPVQAAQRIQDLLLMVGIIWADQEVNVDRRRLFGRGCDSKFNVGYEKLDPNFTPFALTDSVVLPRAALPRANAVGR
jgi:hypothetical protein